MMKRNKEEKNEGDEKFFLEIWEWEIIEVVDRSGFK